VSPAQPSGETGKTAGLCAGGFSESCGRAGPARPLASGGQRIADPGFAGLQRKGPCGKKGFGGDKGALLVTFGRRQK